MTCPHICHAVKPLVFALTAGFILLAVDEVQAELLRFDFSGNITSVEDTLGFLVGTGIDTTDTFSGFFMYDDSVFLSQNPFDPTVGDASNLGDLSITLHSGAVDYTGFVTGTMAAQKHDNNTIFNDALFINGNGATFPAPLVGTFGPKPNALQVAFRDNTSAAFSDHLTLPSSLQLSPAGLLDGTILFTASFGDETGFLGRYKVIGTINSITLPGQVAGDLSGDGFVGVDDLNIVLLNWNQSVTPGDLSLGDPDGSGFVGVDDLNIILVNWNNGTPPPPGSAIPEPGAVALLGVGGVAMFRRRG